MIKVLYLHGSARAYCTYACSIFISTLAPTPHSLVPARPMRPEHPCLSVEDGEGALDEQHGEGEDTKQGGHIRRQE